MKDAGDRARITIMVKIHSFRPRPLLLMLALGWILLLHAAVAGLHSPQDLAFAPDGQTLAVTDATDSAVVSLDPVRRKITRTVQLAGAPAGVAWAGDGKRLFVSESGAYHIAEIEAASGAITRRINTARYPHGLAVANQSGLLLATDWGLDRLAIIDIASGTTKALVPTGRQPTCVAISPDETLAFVSNLIPATAANASDHAGDISVIDLKSLKPKTAIRLPLGSTNVRGIAIDGNAPTLKDVINRRNEQDNHGLTSHLTSGQIEYLAAHLELL